MAISLNPVFKIPMFLFLPNIIFTDVRNSRHSKTAAVLFAAAIIIHFTATLSRIILRMVFSE